MEYTFKILDQLTGYVGEKKFSCEDFMEEVLYLWSDGNYSCDCNRQHFCYGYDGDDAECGDERFLIVDVIPMPDVPYTHEELIAELNCNH
jgi:hypothetical protein